MDGTPLLPRQRPGMALRPLLPLNRIGTVTGYPKFQPNNLNTLSRVEI
jgi:hypothetical protein